MDCLCPVDLRVQGVIVDRRCGYCEACLLTKRQAWSARIQLEASCHAENIFVTLTYSPEHLPPRGELCPRDLELFWKRLRKALSPLSIRYFACGEYGSRSRRPHYHAVLFGVGVSVAELLGKCWAKGHTRVDPLTPARASYVAKYVCKAVSGDSDVPQDFQPEFARMSRRHGLAHAYIQRIAEVVRASNTRQAEAGYPPIASRVGGSIMIGGHHYPMDRYLKEGLPEGESQQAKALRLSGKKLSLKEKEARRNLARARGDQVRRKLRRVPGVL